MSVLGDPAARAIEAAFDFERGWFDNDEGEAVLSPKELRLLSYFRELDPTLQGLVLENVRELVERKASLAESLVERLKQLAPHKSRT